MCGVCKKVISVAYNLNRIFIYINKTYIVPIYLYRVCSMPNRTGSGFHVSDLLEILKIDRLTNNGETQNWKYFHA